MLVSYLIVAVFVLSFYSLQMQKHTFIIIFNVPNMCQMCQKCAKLSYKKRGINALF